MMKKRLTKKQRKDMKEFYSFPATKVLFGKSERKKWDEITKEKSSKFDFKMFKEKCPAYEHQVRKSYESGKNIQSASFSECVYAQTLAKMLGMTVFVNHLEGETNESISEEIFEILKECRMRPRYFYLTPDGSRILVQAGGNKAPDCAVISTENNEYSLIEFKESGSKCSEHDLPEYKNDGKIVVEKEWVRKHPHYGIMVKEAKRNGLNFFEIEGHNYNQFSRASVAYAVDHSYLEFKKYAEVICTEDIDSNLVMLPADNLSKWAESIQGEIRPAGRNAYPVWTKDKLRKCLLEKGATIKGNRVKIPKAKLKESKERGGTRITRYKINSLFFLHVGNCEEKDDVIVFDIDKVEQLKPTVSGKMGFSDLEHQKIKKYYNL